MEHLLLNENSHIISKRQNNISNIKTNIYILHVQFTKHDITSACNVYLYMYHLKKGTGKKIMSKRLGA